jgi:HSP20 family protein
MPWTKRALPTLPERVVEGPFRLIGEFEPLFERFFGGWPLAWAEEPRLAPWGVEMEEAEKETLVRMELPGFEPAEVEVRVTGNVLTVLAEHKVPEGKEKEKERKAYWHARINRTVTLPPFTELEKVEAFYRNGVLEVRLPKKPEAEGRRIEVKT